MSDAIGKLEDIRRIIESKRNQLESLSRSIWNQPEFSFSEKFAHDAITDYLENNGFVVERNFVVATGFRATAEISGGVEGSAKGLTAGFVCDYDALPQMGHTSGHNLRTYCSVAAAVGLKQFLSENHYKGNVVVLGTPGEDCGCGTKIQMLRKGVFAGIDFCMMPTPLTYNILFPKHYSLAVLSVTYRGKASHASAYPWEGRNALDAAVACYNNIALNRQQMKPTTNINGIITEGGTQPNVVPHRSSLKFWLRAPDIAELMMLQARCNACVLSAAKATGCEVQFEFQDDQYQPMEHNQPMGFVYKRHSEAMGITCTEDRSILQTHIGSTDFGNVSHTLPCIAPAYNIGTKAVLHSEGFHLASGSVDAHGQTFRVAVALGQTAAEIMTTPKLWQEIKSSHEASCKLPLPSAAIIAERGRSASVSAVI